MNDDYQEINQALVRVYNGILWVEEHELRKSMFRDLTIKEMIYRKRQLIVKRILQRKRYTDRPRGSI